MTKNWSFAKITDILLKKNLRSVIVSQNHYLNKILDVHPLNSVSQPFPKISSFSGGVLGELRQGRVLGKILQGRVLGKICHGAKV